MPREFGERSRFPCISVTSCQSLWGMEHGRMGGTSSPDADTHMDPLTQAGPRPDRSSLAPPAALSSRGMLMNETPEMPPSCAPPSSPWLRQFHFTPRTHPRFDVSSAAHTAASLKLAGVLPHRGHDHTYPRPSKKKPWDLPEPPHPGELSLKDWQEGGFGHGGAMVSL